MSIYLSLVVALIGVLVYLLTSPAATKDKIAECGRLAYFAGLFAFLILVAGKVVNLFGR